LRTEDQDPTLWGGSIAEPIDTIRPRELDRDTNRRAYVAGKYKEGSLGIAWYTTGKEYSFERASVWFKREFDPIDQGKIGKSRTNIGIIKAEIIGWSIEYGKLPKIFKWKGNFSKRI